MDDKERMGIREDETDGQEKIGRMRGVRLVSEIEGRLTRAFPAVKGLGEPDRLWKVCFNNVLRAVSDKASRGSGCTLFI